MEVFSVLTGHFTEATTHLWSRVSTILRLRGPSSCLVDTTHAMPALLGHPFKGRRQVNRQLVCTAGLSLARESGSLTRHHAKRSTEGRLFSHRGNSGESAVMTMC